MTELVVHGVSLEEIRNVLRHSKNALDPLCFFKFVAASETQHSALRFDTVIARKEGSDAGHYAGQLESRLRELGLTEANVSSPPSRGRDTYIQFRCSEEFKERIRAAAGFSDQDMSNFIRNAILAQLEKNTN